MAPDRLSGSLLPQEYAATGLHSASLLPKVQSWLSVVALALGFIYASDGEIVYPEWIYDYIADWQPEVLWMLIVGLILAFGLAFSVGSNDCANSLGTAVGSGVMTLRVACVCGTIFETIGVMFLSGNVISTLTTGLLDIQYYKTDYNEMTMEFTPGGNETLDPEKDLMLGQIAVIVGSAAWQIVASYFAWPVSCSHSIVGSLLGYALCASASASNRGFGVGIQWKVLIKIVIAWFASPLLATIFAIALYWPIRKYIVMAEDPLAVGLYAFPLLWGLAGVLNAGVILTSGNLFSDLTGLDTGMLWACAAGFGVALALIIGITVYLDWWGFNALRDLDASKGAENKVYTIADEKFGANQEAEQESDPEIPDPDDDDVKTTKLFQALLWVSACSGCMAHGGNDVGNAIGPAVLLWLIYQTPLTFEVEDAPYWILFYGGVGISAGLWMFGHRTIETLGKNLTKITPSRGFSAELMCAATVQVASALGIPVSTTQCKVGAVVGIGLIRGKNEVDLKLFSRIAVSWVITIPASGLVTAALYEILHVIVF